MCKILKVATLIALIVMEAVPVFGSNITAFISDTTSEGKIVAGKPFTLKIATYNDFGQMIAISIPTTIYSPDNSIENIEYINVQGLSFADRSDFSIKYSDSSITDYNNWADNWNMIYGFFAVETDGILPDTVNHTPIAGGQDAIGWLPDDEMTVRIGYNFIIDEEGIFCIDSCSVPGDTPPGKFNWLFVDSDVPFNGPYCWEVIISTMCGDVTADETVNILDILALISYIYQDGENAYHPNSGEVNGDGLINILDVITLIRYCYENGELNCQ